MRLRLNIGWPCDLLRNEWHDTSSRRRCFVIANIHKGLRKALFYQPRKRLLRRLFEFGFEPRNIIIIRPKFRRNFYDLFHYCFSSHFHFVLGCDIIVMFAIIGARLWLPLSLRRQWWRNFTSPYALTCSLKTFKTDQQRASGLSFTNHLQPAIHVCFVGRRINHSLD